MRQLGVLGWCALCAGEGRGTSGISAAPYSSAGIGALLEGQGFGVYLQVSYKQDFLVTISEAGFDFIVVLK